MYMSATIARSAIADPCFIRFNPPSVKSTTLESIFGLMNKNGSNVPVSSSEKITILNDYINVHIKNIFYCINSFIVVLIIDYVSRYYFSEVNCGAEPRGCWKRSKHACEAETPQSAPVTCCGASRQMIGV